MNRFCRDGVATCNTGKPSLTSSVLPVVMGLFQAATNQADVIPFPAKAATQSTMRIDGAASSYEGKNQSRAPC